MRKRLMILTLVLIAVLMTCTLAACSGGGGRCSGGHTWDEGTVKEAATCTESGTLINKCTVCGIKREVAIEALGHDLQTIPGTVVEPTCEVDGYAGKKACVREGCEYVLDTGTIIPALGHAYGDWTSNGDGTHKRVCSNDSNHVESGNCSGGTADCGHKAVCDVCGGEYGDFASSHVFDKQVTTDVYKATDATCEAKATYYYSCQCGEKGTETFEYGDYAAHVFDREVADPEYLVSVATCTSPAIYNKSCACGLEGTETFEYGNALPHTFDNEVATDAYKATDATCTAKATYYYSCDCGAHGTATFAYGDMLAHVYDKEVAEDKYLASAATCEKKATYYKSCYCGHFDAEESATFESGELGDHVYDNKVVNETYKATDATCTEKATYYFSCDCGKAGTETFESGETLPHVYDKEVAEDKYLKFAANCASAAVYYKSCACGHFDAETSPTFYFGAPSGNHVFDREVATDGYKATDATCTTKATYYYSCECGEKGTTTFESGATLDHTMTHHAAIDATCVSTGNVEYWTCSTCSLNYDSATGGNVIEDVTTAIDSTNHVHTTISKPAVAPDCENTGLTAEISCADCDKVLEEREEIPALGHDMGDWFVSHEPTCTVTGVNERTCKRDDCDYFETEAIPTIAHSVTTLHPEVPATCTKTGTREYYECENCDKYVVNDGEFKTSWGDIVIKVDATNHVHIEKLDGKAASCTETGLTEGEKCTDCGATIKAQEEIPALGHSGGAAVKENVVAATCTVAGSYDSVVYCSVCDAEVSRTEVTEDATGHTPVKNVCSCGYEYSVDEIIALAEALAKGDSLNGTYRLSGVITNADAFNTKYNSVTVTISVDGATEEFSLLCYGMKGEGAEVIGVGDTITVSGEIKNYNGTIEFNTGCALESYIPAEFEVYLEVFGKGTVSGIPAGTLARGDEVTFTANANDGYKVSKVLVNGQSITSETNEYTFVVKEDTTLEVRFDKEGNNNVVEDIAGTITFAADKAQRVSYSSTQQVWENDGVTFTNNKGSSTSPVGDYTNPVRMYKNSTVIISATGITQIVLYGSGESKYWTPLETDLKTVENATVSIDSSNKILTIKFNTPVNSFEFVCKAGQARLGKIVVSYQVESTSGSACAHENWSDYVVTTPATCSERGVETATCAECGETKTRQIPVDPTLHVYNETITTPATCTQPGLKTLTCECGNTKTEEIPATGHNYNSVVTAPTCTADGYTTHTCSVCGDTYKDNETKAKGHTEETIPAVAPGCESEGLTDGKKCSVCGEITVEQSVVPATGHTEVVDEAVEATCTTAGKTEGKHCSVCNEVLVAQTVVPAKGHSEKEPTKEKVVDATCEADGSYEMNVYCATCGELLSSQKYTTDKLGHDYVSTVTKEPTCTETGVRTYVCTHDNSHTYTEVIEKLSHTPAAAVEENREEATCTKEGSYDSVVYCTVCGEELSRETKIIDKVAHNEVIDVAKAPKCEETGLTEGKHCSVCGEVLVAQTVVDALGHEWKWVIDTPATVTSTGLKHEECTRCDATQSHNTIIDILICEHTDTLVHNAKVDADCENAGNIEYWHCTACGKNYSDVNGQIAVENITIPATGHNYNSVVTAPTCTTGGYTTHTCANCDDTYTDTTVDALGHTEVIDEAVAPTCTETGLTEGKHCSVCGEVFVAQTVVEAKGHRWGSLQVTSATCTVDGYITITCGDCGIVRNSIDHDEAKEYLEQYPYFDLEAKGHDYQAVVTAPTCTADGYTTHTCSKCADSYVDTYVDKLGHDLVTAYEVVVVEGVNTLHQVTKCVREGCEHIAEDVTVDTTNSVAVANEKDLRTVLENGFKAQLAEDVDLVNGSIDLVGVSATLDLNGHNISVVGTKYAETTGMYVCGVFYLDGATLTIDGEGELFASVDKADSIYVISAINGSNVTLNGGTYRSSGCTTIYGRTNTAITINGGTYIAEVDWEGLYFTLDILESELKDGTNATINVYGGTFHNFDPANHTNDGTYTNKVMDGYHSIKDGDNYVVSAHIAGATVKENIVNATCTKTGKHDDVVYCTACNAELSRTTVIDAVIAHTEVVDAAVDATCTTAGKTEGKHCSVCGEILVAQQEISALGHTGGTATCTEKATCTVCGEAYGEFAAHTEEIIPAVDATCTKTGLTEGKKCSVCGEITLAQTELSPLGHSMSATETNYCDTCKQTLSHAEAIEAAYKLTGDTTFKGELTGTVTEINTEFNAGYNNISVTIQVTETRDILCFRMKADSADSVIVGDTITVSGTIKNYNGTIEFDAGCTFVLVKGANVNITSAATTNGSFALSASGEVARGTKVFVTPTPADGYKVGAVKVNGASIQFENDEYSFVALVDTEVSVEFVSESTVLAQSVTVNTFANKGIMQGEEVISWTLDGVTITSNKSDSTTTIRTSDEDHYRAYKGSKIYVQAQGNITEIVFNCLDSSYATVLGNSISKDGVSVDVSDSTVTVTGIDADTWSTLNLTAQTRFNFVKVTYAPACAHESCTIVEEEISATCTTDGKTAVKKCNVCGEEFGGETILASHDMGEWTTTTAATCTTAGERTRSCNRADCDHTETETIDATGHNFVDGKCTNNDCTATESTTKTLKKVTDATTIKNGDVIVIVCESKKMELSGGMTSSTTYGTGAAYSDAPTGAYKLTVVAGSTSGSYAFKTSDGKYLYYTGSKNTLTTTTSVTDASSWTVSVDANGNATIANVGTTARKLQWNASSPRFACYTSTQTAIQLYVYA